MNRLVILFFATSLTFLAAGCSGAAYKATCQTDADCFYPEYACATSGSPKNVCLLVCTTNAGCYWPDYCDIPSGASSGVCQPRTACPNGDSDCTGSQKCTAPSSGVGLSVCM
jgi:hypothetical protein